MKPPVANKKYNYFYFLWLITYPCFSKGKFTSMFSEITVKSPPVEFKVIPKPVNVKPSDGCCFRKPVSSKFKVSFGRHKAEKKYCCI